MPAKLSNLLAAPWLDVSDAMILMVGMNLLSDLVLARHGVVVSTQRLDLCGITVARFAGVLEEYHKAVDAVRLMTDIQTAPQ